MPNEPEANKLFRMVMKYKGSDLHLKVGLAPAMRLAGVLRQMQLPPLTERGHGTADVPAALAAPEDDPGGRPAASTSPTSSSSPTATRPASASTCSGSAAGSAWSPAASTPRSPTSRGSACPRSWARSPATTRESSSWPASPARASRPPSPRCSSTSTTRERCHIVTIEDPIEFTFKDDKCIINQREVGIDVIDWDTALKHAVRQDPDIILVGEMRDRETFNAAMHAAETGHLVFGTIHASSAPSTISRILDLFPQDMHAAMRQNLAFNLKAIVAQKLLPTTKDWAASTGQTRVPARRDHADEPDRQEADPQRGRHQAGAGHPAWARKKGWSTSPRACGSSWSPRRSNERRRSRSPRTPSSCKMALKGITVPEPGIL